MRKIQIIFMSLALLMGSKAGAEIPAALTEKIHKGSGTIDLLIDILPTELQEYLAQGTMFLGVDVNENAEGPETSKSAGLAIKDITLSLQTTDGDFSFSDFYTNTTAMILEAGADSAEEFYTVFGATGSNQINGGTGGFDVGAFDDVIELRNITVDGDIIGASLSVTFLETADNAGFNESFFDFSNGFEDFAVFSEADAQVLESANVGITEETQQQVSFAMTVPSGTPEPAWFLALLVPLLLLARQLLGAA
jgi:hypothetical protein